MAMSGVSFWLSQRGGCCWRLVGRGRAAGRHPRRHRTAPTMGNHTPLHPSGVSSAEAGRTLDCGERDLFAEETAEELRGPQCF